MSEPVRVVWCITDLDPGGAERALVQIVTRLDRSRFQPQVICLMPRGALADELEQAGVPVHCLDARNRWDFVRVTGRLVQLLRQLQPELVQTFLYHANIVGRFAAWRAQVPHVVSGIRVAERRSRWRLRLDRWTSGLVDRHVCVSRAVADFSIRQGGLPATKVVVIPNGVDAERFASARPADLSSWGVPHDSRVVLTVCRLDPQKGITILIEAFAPLANTFADVHLVIVGEGPQQAHLVAQIERQQLSGRVHLVGWRDDVPALLKRASCFVLSSLWEGMPNVVLEAMAAGVPVVSTRVEGTKELVTSGETGILVEPGNSVALATEIGRVFNDPDRATKLAYSGQRLVVKDFTWNSVVNAYTRLYEQVLIKRSG